jgi:hypothetical protein
MSVNLPMPPRAGVPQACVGVRERPYPAPLSSFSRGGTSRLPMFCPKSALRTEQEAALLVTSCWVDTSGTDRQHTNSERHRLSPTALRCLGGPKVSTVSTMSKESMR